MFIPNFPSAKNASFSSLVQASSICWGPSQAMAAAHVLLVFVVGAALRGKQTVRRRRPIEVKKKIQDHMPYFDTKLCFFVFYKKTTDPFDTLFTCTKFGKPLFYSENKAIVIYRCFSALYCSSDQHRQFCVKITRLPTSLLLFFPHCNCVFFVWIFVAQ